MEETIGSHFYYFRIKYIIACLHTYENNTDGETF